DLPQHPLGLRRAGRGPGYGRLAAARPTREEAQADQAQAEADQGDRRSRGDDGHGKPPMQRLHRPAAAERRVKALAAHLVHLYTASGVVLALLALDAGLRGRPRAAFVLLTLAVFVDASDG